VRYRSLKGQGGLAASEGKDAAAPASSQPLEVLLALERARTLQQGSPAGLAAVLGGGAAALKAFSDMQQSECGRVNPQMKVVERIALLAKLFTSLSTCERHLPALPGLGEWNSWLRGPESSPGGPTPIIIPG